VERFYYVLKVKAVNRMIVLLNVNVSLNAGGHLKHDIILANYFNIMNIRLNSITQYNSDNKKLSLKVSVKQL